MQNLSYSQHKNSLFAKLVLTLFLSLFEDEIQKSSFYRACLQVVVILTFMTSMRENHQCMYWHCRWFINSIHVSIHHSSQLSHTLLQKDLSLHLIGGITVDGDCFEHVVISLKDSVHFAGLQQSDVGGQGGGTSIWRKTHM